MTPVIRKIFSVLLVTLHHSDPFTDDIALSEVTFKFSVPNFPQGSNKVIRMFIQANSQGVKNSLISQTMLFSFIGKIKEVLNLGIGLFQINAWN